MIELDKISGFALDCGGTKTAAAKIANGKIVQRVQAQTPTDASVEQLVDAFTALLEELQPNRQDHICVALTGRVDQHGMWYAVNQSTLGRVDKVPIARLLESRLQRKAHVINDAVAGAIAEHLFGAGCRADRMAYITVSTGVGAGIILNGQPLLSPNGLAGHVGFTSSPQAQSRCGSGRIGTVESIASGTAIAEFAKKAGYSSDTAAVFSAFRNGEPWATDIVTLSATAIADLIADLVVTLDLGHVVLGGSVGLAEGYIEQVHLAQGQLPEMFQVPTVCASLEDSVLLGALAHASIPGP